MSEPVPDAPQVLSGVRIIDAGTVLAAPGASGLLADFGAEVIKVEQPGRGDPVRGYPPQADGHSLTHKVTNRNKKCVTLNLSDARGQDVFRRLVGRSDAVVLNYRTPTIRKWGLDYDDLRAVNPKIVMLHLTGYGRTGPYQDRPGFARSIEAYAGLTYMTGYPDRGPVPAGYAIADALGGVYGAMSLMLGLLHQKLAGEGQLIDLALAEVMMRAMDHVYIGYDQTGVVPERVGTINPAIAPHDIYPTSDDGWISLPVSTENMFTRLCLALELGDLSADPRFVTNIDRVAHRAELDALVRPALLSMTTAEALTRLQGVGVAASRINSVAELVDDEQVLARQSLMRVRDDDLDRDLLMQNVVPRLSGTPGRVRWPGRPLGQDNDDVYRGLVGLSSDECDELRGLGVI